MYDEDFGGPYVPPERTRATRMFPARSRASARGFLVAKLRAQAAWRQLIFESHLERKCLLVLLYQHAVVDVWDQTLRKSHSGDERIIGILEEQQVSIDA
ncbi:hypothetical protein [Salipiger pallidus]|nr:hypothetical protein [Salipiger pallidus]